jgi:FtsZ-interacting cell division protein YlmF
MVDKCFHAMKYFSLLRWDEKKKLGGNQQGRQTYGSKPIATVPGTTTSSSSSSSSSSTSSVPDAAIAVASMHAPASAKAREYRNMKEEEWNTLARCKRLWGARVLSQMLEGVPVEKILKSVNEKAALAKPTSAYMTGLPETKLVDVERLKQDAKIMASKVQKFCAEIGDVSLERILKDFKETFDEDTKDIKKLLLVPGMTVRVAKGLFLHCEIVDHNDLASVSSIDEVALKLHLLQEFRYQDFNEDEDEEHHGEKQLSPPQRQQQQQQENQQQQSEENQQQQSVEGDSAAPQGIADIVTDIHMDTVESVDAPAVPPPKTKDELMRERIKSHVLNLVRAAKNMLEEELEEQNKTVATLAAAIEHADMAVEGREGNSSFSCMLGVTFISYITPYIHFSPLPPSFP